MIFGVIINDTVRMDQASYPHCTWGKNSEGDLQEHYIIFMFLPQIYGWRDVSKFAVLTRANEVAGWFLLIKLPEH